MNLNRGGQRSNEGRPANRAGEDEGSSRPLKGNRMNEGPPTTDASKPPFFIVGCGRSGTTYLRSMLNRHRKIAIPVESLFIVDYLRVEEEFRFDDLLDLLVSEPEIREWGLKVTREDFAGTSRIAEALERLLEIYVQQEGKQIWGQKTPRFVRHLDLLRTTFPSARFVHIVRDPRAVANSMIRSDVHRSTAYHASIRWLRDVGAGLQFEQEHPEIALRVTYEELIREPERTLDEVLKHVAASFQPDLLSSDDDPLDQYSEFYSSIHANLGYEPMTENIDKWRNKLSDENLRVVEAMCGSLMDRLGYERCLEEPALDPGDKRRANLQRALGFFGQLWRYLRYRRRYLFYLIWRKWRLGLLWRFLGDVNQ